MEHVYNKDKTRSIIQKSLPKRYVLLTEIGPVKRLWWVAYL